MYIFNKFTAYANTVLNLAIETAEQLGHVYVGTEHIVLGILKEKQSVACKILNEQDITYQEYLKKVVNDINIEPETFLTADDFTPATKRVLKLAVMEGARLNKELISTEIILLALVEQQECKAIELLYDLDIDMDELLFRIDISMEDKEMTSEKSNKNNKKENKIKLLPQYSENLMEKARNGEIDPVIGREKEIQRMVAILSRRKKNNPCLIGEAGVGKTALAEGLALKITNGEVPGFLKDKEIYLLDLNLVIAGTKYRGDFEDRIKGIIDEVSQNENIILFIDEIHTIVGAGSAEGGADAANIMKPILSKGKFKVIGATTIKEYRKFIEKDSALERRFAPIKVEEPTAEETIIILTGIRDKLEAHHHIEISDEAIESAVSLSKRYITDRFLPDKAIDLVDEASAMIRSRASIENNEDILLEKHIQEVISRWTEIPLEKLSSTDSKRLLNMENNLKKAVIGQDKAIKSLCDAIRRSRIGLNPPNRPIGSFMFLGSSGVGKTLLCKELAKQMFLKEDSIIKLDMSEYMEKHSVAKLIGAPPGYVGFDEGGYLTERVAKNPYSLILFDEIEKAHVDVCNILLQVLDEGKLTDSQGHCVDFKNTIIIFTSNIGSDILTNSNAILGFNSGENTVENQDRQVIRELKKRFKVEFINRLDEVIVFKKLDRKDIKEITEIELNNLSERATNIGIELTFSDNCVEAISKEGYSDKYGAREIDRIISKNIENILTYKYLNKEFTSCNKVLCNYVDDEYTLTGIDERVIAS